MEIEVLPCRNNNVVIQTAPERWETFKARLQAEDVYLPGDFREGTRSYQMVYNDKEMCAYKLTVPGALSVVSIQLYIPNSEALIQGMNYLRKLIAEKAGLDPISTPCTIQKVAHPQGKIIIVVAIDLPASVIPLIKPMIGSSLEKLGNYVVKIQFLMPPVNSSKWKRLMIHTQESRQQHFENYPGGEPEARRRIHIAPWAEQDPYALKILREATQHLEWLSLDNRFKNTPVTSFKIYAGAHLLKVTDVGPNDIESYLATKTNTFFE